MANLAALLLFWVCLITHSACFADGDHGNAKGSNTIVSLGMHSLKPLTDSSKTPLEDLVSEVSIERRQEAKNSGLVLETSVRSTYAHALVITNPLDTMSIYLLRDGSPVYLPTVMSRRLADCEGPCPLRTPFDLKGVYRNHVQLAYADYSQEKITLEPNDCLVYTININRVLLGQSTKLVSPPDGIYSVGTCIRFETWVGDAFLTSDVMSDFIPVQCGKLPENLRSAQGVCLYVDPTSDQNVRVSFFSASYDAGPISRLKAALVSHDFQIWNYYAFPVEISRIAPSCSCVSVTVYGMEGSPSIVVPARGFITLRVTEDISRDSDGPSNRDVAIFVVGSPRSALNLHYNRYPVACHGPARL